MPILDFQKILFRLHPEKLSPRIKQLVELAEKEVLHESHATVATLSHTEAVTLHAACEARLHALTTTGMTTPAALEGTVAALENAYIKDLGPFNLRKIPVPEISPVPHVENIHPVVEHIVDNLRSGEDHTRAFQNAAQLSPDLLQQLKGELKETQREMFASGDLGEKVRAHSIDHFLAPLEVGELVPKKGLEMFTNEPRPYRGPGVNR